MDARPATGADLALLLPRVRAFFQSEGIRFDDAVVPEALARLLADEALGIVLIAEMDGAAVGYAAVTYGFDVEYGGRDAYLTDLWLDRRYFSKALS